MIVDWVSNNPTWLWGSIFVGLTTLIACLGLLVVNRFVDVKSRTAHNEAAGAFMTVIGTAYAVLVAFLAVAAWQAFTDAGKATRRKPIISATFMRIRPACTTPRRRASATTSSYISIR
jgi:hypothetical protein